MPTVKVTSEKRIPTNAVPDGYMRNTIGHLVLIDEVREIDKLRDETVRELAGEAKRLRDELQAFKQRALDSIAAFVALSNERYGVVLGGEKGNVQLLSYDGSLKVVRAMADRIDFDEKLAAAKALIDECIHAWSDGANPHIRVLTNRAFHVDKKGKLNTQLVLDLLRYDIQHEKWQKAMEAIKDSITVVHTSTYVRFYERDEQTGQHVAIVLDLAAL